MDIGAGDQLVVDNSGDHAIVLTASGFTSDQIEDRTALTAVRAGVAEPNRLLPAGLLPVPGGLSLFIFWQVRREQA